MTSDNGLLDTATANIPTDSLDFRRPSIVPVPAEMTYKPDVAVVFGPDTRLAVSCPDAAAVPWMESHLRKWFGFSPRIETNAAIIADVPPGAEGYALSAKPGRIALAANTLQGARYAAYTLRQAAERISVGRTTAGWWMPELEVRDAPMLGFRGMHFCWFPELSRTYIEHQLRMAAYYKFNFAVIEPWGVFRSERHPWHAIPGAPLTIEEAKRLTAIAKDLGLTIVPQLNILGHATGARGRVGKHVALDFHPEVAPIFEPAGGWNWCLSNPDAVAVVHDLVAELHDAFGNPPFFHIGCDEADPPTCPVCRGVKPYAKLVERHIKGVHDLLATRGARVLMWHDMLLEKGKWNPFYANGSPDDAKMAETLPRDIVVCDWYYGKNYGRVSEPESYTTLEHFTQLGYDTVTCPWDDLVAIEAQGRYARKAHLFGLLETVWNHFQGRDFARMMATASCAAWGTAAPSSAWCAESYDGDPWTLPAEHWRQMGRDMGPLPYAETGFADQQVTLGLRNDS